MTTSSRTYPNLYKDSVSLMTVSAHVLAVPGITGASVVMASATNVENLREAGLGDFAVHPNDLVVAVAGEEDACAQALEAADGLLTASAAGGEESTVAQTLTSIQMAAMTDPATNFALVSVPGDYAAAEAMKALRLGMDVMIFSDNVSVADEVRVKRYADAHDLMVMGPDCGTAIVNGVPLGFANVVRRGPVGVVGASGTGTQEVTVRVHQQGSGISQALGTGGHDLSDAVGGISMLHGMHALADDPATEVVVLVSKPPSPVVAERMLAAAEGMRQPVVVIFLGADPEAVDGKGVYGASSLAEAADMAAAAARGEVPERRPLELTPEDRRRLRDTARSMAPSQRYVRGVFSGGTFCFEAQVIHRAAGTHAYSNTPSPGNQVLPDIRTSVEHTIIDMGDDQFTQGRPHPMIDPSLRDARVRQEAGDPGTAVVLFDVVLGYGASATPAADLVGVIGSARAKARSEGRNVAFIGYVCGTDLDPQNRAAVVDSLRAAGVLVASSNAEAATWAATIVAARRELGAEDER